MNNLAIKETVLLVYRHCRSKMVRRKHRTDDLQKCYEAAPPRQLKRIINLVNVENRTLKKKKEQEKTKPKRIAARGHEHSIIIVPLRISSERLRELQGAAA